MHSTCLHCGRPLRTPRGGCSTYTLAATQSAGHTSKTLIKIRCNQRCQQTDEMVQPNAQHVSTLRKPFAHSRRGCSTYILAATRSGGERRKTSITIRATNDVSKQEIRWCNSSIKIRTNHVSFRWCEQKAQHLPTLPFRKGGGLGSSHLHSRWLVCRRSPGGR